MAATMLEDYAAPADEEQVWSVWKGNARVQALREGANSMKKADIGLIGLAVMGENLVMNMESKGFTVAVFNRTTSKVTHFVEGRAQGQEHHRLPTPSRSWWKTWKSPGRS